MAKNNPIFMWKMIFLMLAMTLLLNFALAIPNSINIQGKLTNKAGSIQTGAFNFTFRIYDSFTNGNLLYETNAIATTDSRGVYDIIIKGINLSFQEQLYLAVKVNADGEMEPRINLTSVPYTFRANISDDLNRDNNYIIAGLNASGTIQGTILSDGNATITQGIVSAAQIQVGGGFSGGGLTLDDKGNIITQGDVLFSGNITVLNVTFLSVNGSLLPSLDNQFDIGNGSLRWRNAYFGGNVGIGASSPNYFLQVASGTDGRSVNLSNVLYVNGSSGNVGIGTATPGAELWVEGVTGDNRITLATKNQSGQAQMDISLYADDGTIMSGLSFAIYGNESKGTLFDAPKNNSAFLYAARGNLFELERFLIGGRASVDLRFVTNNLQRMIIDTSGNVGIGTTTPNDILEVIGNVRVSGSLNATSINATNLYAVSYNIGWTNLSSYPSACSPGQFMTSVGDTIGCGSPAETSTAAGGWANTSTVTATDLSVVVDSGTFYVNATTNNIGIGTTSPSSLLQVAGTANITSASTQFLVNSNGDVTINLKG